MPQLHTHVWKDPHRQFHPRWPRERAGRWTPSRVVDKFHKAQQTRYPGSRTPGSSRAPSTDSPSTTLPMVPPGDTSDQDSNPGDSGASNPGGTAGQGSGQKTTATPTGETNMGPPSRPSASQNTMVGSPNQTGNPLLTPYLAQAHQDAMRSARMAAYQQAMNTRY